MSVVQYRWYAWGWMVGSSKGALTPSARHWLRSGLAALASKGASVKVRVTPQVCACFIASRRRSLRRFAGVSDTGMHSEATTMWSRPFALHATLARARAAPCRLAPDTGICRCTKFSVWRTPHRASRPQPIEWYGEDGAVVV
eukprot:6635032-Prymnesium_polylepis.1